MRRYFGYLLLFLFSMVFANVSYAGGLTTYTVTNVQSASLACDGTLTVTFDWSQFLGEELEVIDRAQGDVSMTAPVALSAPGLGIDVTRSIPVPGTSGTAMISASATVIPAAGTQVPGMVSFNMLEIGVLESELASPQGLGSGANEFMVTVPDCDEPIPVASGCFDDGRLNESCDVAAIYSVSDSEGTHMAVYYVPRGSSGDFGVFGFIVYQDELEALPDNPEEPIVIDSAANGYITLYKLPSGEYQINAGPINDEGTIRVFQMETFPAGATEFEINGAE